jgi:hypothetical protein
MNGPSIRTRVRGSFRLALCASAVTTIVILTMQFPTLTRLLQSRHDEVPAIVAPETFAALHAPGAPDTSPPTDQPMTPAIPIPSDTSSLASPPVNQFTAPASSLGKGPTRPESPLASLLDVFPNLRKVNFSLPCNAYYINLDESVGRRKAMESTFGKLWGDRLYRIPAVRGSDRAQVVALVGKREAARAMTVHNMTRGAKGLAELGVILSHLTAIKTAYLAGDR